MGVKWFTFAGWWFGTFFYFYIYWEFHHPNWRTHVFQRGRYTTNQFGLQLDFGTSVCWNMGYPNQIIIILPCLPVFTIFPWDHHPKYPHRCWFCKPAINKGLTPHFFILTWPWLEASRIGQPTLPAVTDGNSNQQWVLLGSAQWIMIISNITIYSDILINGNLRILKWRYCTISGHILWDIPPKIVLKICQK